MSTPSIQVEQAPQRAVPAAHRRHRLILGQRLGEWCGHAPVLEEDIALANIALDLHRPGARAAHARRPARRPGPRRRPARVPARGARLPQRRRSVELPRGDFAVHRAAQRHDGHLVPLLWERLRDSSDAELAAHRRQGGEGSALPPAARGRLGGAAGRRHRRVARAACAPRSTTLWRYTAELFDADAVDAAAAASGLGPRWGELREPWLAEMRADARRSRAADAGRLGASAAPASAACTASTWASSWPRCSTCSAPIPGACGERGRPPARVDAPGRCSATVLDPEVPALSVCDLGIVRDVIDHDDGSSKSC